MSNDAPTTIKEARKRESTHGRSRAQDTWDNVDVHALENKPWTLGQSLEAPPPRKGMRQRWVRVAIRGEDDATNVARKMREGWKPRSIDSVPTNFNLPTISQGEWVGCIGVEGMVLMEMPEQLATKRDKFFRDKTDRITTGIEADLQSKSNPMMPISQERSSKVGREVKVAADE
jgi:hypothetical protein